MRCLVTGSSGFIGNALSKKLSNLDHEVIGLIHEKKPKKPIKKVKYVKGDVTDLESLKKVVKNIDYIFHCAAYVKDYGPKNVFYKINYEGTKNLVKTCEKEKIKGFVFISHVHSDSEQKIGYYTETKALAEKYLLKKSKQDDLPAIIIRPGNVYGPGATTWVLRPLKAIQKNRISLINHGNGIFLHTYIDNLVDALISCINNSQAIGEKIDITDGGNNTTWGEYLNQLSKIAGKKEINRNMSKKTAMVIGKIMIFLNKFFRIEPWVTPMAVKIFTNKKKIDIKKAKILLNYQPQVNYEEGMEKIERWLRKNNYIP